MYIVGAGYDVLTHLMNVKLEKELGQEGVRRPDDEGSGLLCVDPLHCAVEWVNAMARLQGLQMFSSRASLAGRLQEGEER